MGKLGHPLQIALGFLVLTLSVTLALESMGLTISITDYSNTFVAIDQKFFTSEDTGMGTLFSGHCKITGYTKSSVPDVVCEVSAHELPHTRNSTTRHCSIRMNPGESIGGIQSKFFGIFELEPLTSTRTLLKWSEMFRYHLYVRVILLDMTDCGAIRMRFHEDMRKGHLFANLVVHYDTFDVLVADDHLCGSDKCRISFNRMGERIGVPAPFRTNFQAAMSTCISDTRQGSRGFFVLGFNDGSSSSSRYRLTHVSESGIEKHLVTFDEHKHLYTAISNAHHRYTICVMLMYTGEVHCPQYDMHGNIKLNQRMTLTKNSTLLGVHNLVGGELLLLTSDCQETQPFWYKCSEFMINKMHKNGQLDRMFKVANHRILCDLSSRNTRMQVFESDGEYCFCLSCMHREKSGGIDEVTFNFEFKSACVSKVHMDHKLVIY